MTGRPTIRTDAMVDDIIDRLAKGEPLAAICRTPGYPHPSTFRDWCNGDEELSRRFARAREDGFDAIAESTLDIVDNVEEDPASRRVRAETRLKLLAKWDPKRYGDKLEVGGAGKGGSLMVQVLTGVPDGDNAG